MRSSLSPKPLDEFLEETSALHSVSWDNAVRFFKLESDEGFLGIGPSERVLTEIQQAYPTESGKFQQRTHLSSLLQIYQQPEIVSGDFTLLGCSVPKTGPFRVEMWGIKLEGISPCEGQGLREGKYRCCSEEDEAKSEGEREERGSGETAETKERVAQASHSTPGHGVSSVHGKGVEIVAMLVQSRREPITSNSPNSSSSSIALPSHNELPLGKELNH
nr:hypothetical protein Iba_chr06aCG6110 [Ipomoea batatas]